MIRHTYIGFCFFLVLIFLPFTSCKSTANFFSRLAGGSDIENIYTAYMELGDAYADIEKYDEAIKYYERVLPNKELHYSVLYKLGRSYALSGQWDKSRDCYVKLLERDKNNFSLRSSLAYVTAMSGDIVKAIGMYAELCKEYPENQGILENYITLLISNKNIKDANMNLEILNENFPDSERIKELREKIAEISPAEDKDTIGD